MSAVVIAPAGAEVTISASGTSSPALTGITGWFADLITALGEPGVGVLTFVETVVPPVPSEVVLPLSGFLAQQGQLSLAWVIIASTLGSLAGAWVFYGLGAALGLDRTIALLARIPLVDRGDLERASDWFERHGAWSVFFGRFVPGIRSVVSIPAGVQRMSPLVFTVGTTLGSLSWNTALVGLGYALGTQWDVVGSWASTASNVIVVALALFLVIALVRRHARRRSSPNGREG